MSAVVPKAREAVSWLRRARGHYAATSAPGLARHILRAVEGYAREHPDLTPAQTVAALRRALDAWEQTESEAGAERGPDSTQFPPPEDRSP